MMSSEEFGPSLPPGFQNPVVEVGDESKEGPELPSANVKKLYSDDADIIGPSLPSSVLHGDSDKSDSDVIGPCLPPGVSQKKKPNIIDPSRSSGSSEKDSDVIGPCLPPGVSKSDENETNIIGPCMPPGFSKSRENESNSIGPYLPPGFGQSSGSHTGENAESDDDDDYIGPRPSEISNDEDDRYYTTSEFEKRARLMRDRLEGKETKSEEKLQRESWMMELPSAGLAKNIGLTARTFRTKVGPDMGDRSVWTDTPADRERKEKEGTEEGRDRKSRDTHVTSKRDKQMAKEVDNYNKSKRPMSLLEMHEKERKKLKKEKKDEPKVRRPFDREIDLQSNRFDEAQRQSIIKKSRDLNTKFAKGKFTSQFL